jgi:hypothetical protein
MSERFGENAPRTFYSTMDGKALPIQGAGTPGEALANAVGLAAFQEGTILNEGLKANGEIGKDYRGMYLGWIRKQLRDRSMKTKAVMDSTSAIVHTTTDQEIIDTTRKECPLMELIPQETARGKTTSYDVLSARGAAIFAAEDVAATTAASDTYLNTTKALKIATAWGGWTDFALAALANQYPTRDARALEIRNKTWSLNELWENELINGSSSSGASSAGFVGLRAEIYTTQTIANLPSANGSLNYNINSNDVLDTDIDKAIADMVHLNVKPNLAITDLVTWQKIKQLMMGLVRYVNPESEIAWGLKALAWNTPYGTMPIVASKFMSYGANSREILLLDTKFLAQRILLDSTMEMLAKTTIQQNFVIKKFGTVIDKTQAYAQTYNNNAWPATTTGTSKMARLYAIA